MKIAIIPPADSWFTDNTQAEKWIDLLSIDKSLKEWNNDSEIKMINKYCDLETVDFFVFINWYNFSKKWYMKILRKHLENRTIYWMMEPEVVMPWHTQKEIPRILEYFKYIITWNKVLIDNQRVFYINFPYKPDEPVYGKKFKTKKLLVSISGNKKSENQNELYSERKRVIEYFEEYEVNEFDFYGTGWTDKYRNYRGQCISKSEVYTNYRFALCLENIKDVKGGITEKIIDCLYAHIVPIYQGTDDIDDYIPKECYIDYSQFDRISDLVDYLKQIDEERYQKYIENIDIFLKNKNEKFFSGNIAAKTFILIIENSNVSEFTFTISEYKRFTMLFRYKRMIAKGRLSYYLVRQPYSIIKETFIGKLFRFMLNQIRKLYTMKDRSKRKAYRKSFGKLNPDKTFYIIRDEGNNAGLFSVFKYVFIHYQYAVSKGFIPIVDFKNYYIGMIQDESRRGLDNAWDYYYKQTYSLEEVYNSKNVILCKMGDIPKGYMSDYELPIETKLLYSRYMFYIEHFKYSNELEKLINNFYTELFSSKGRILGVFYRRSFIRGELIESTIHKNHPKQPRLSQIENDMKKYCDEWNCDKIFLSTDDSETRKYFLSIYGERCICVERPLATFYKNEQTVSNTVILSKEYKDMSIKDKTMMYAAETVLLSMCNCLLASKAGGSHAAYLMNGGKYEHVKIYDEGKI